jgi:hypothetical protein
VIFGLNQGTEGAKETTSLVSICKRVDEVKFKTPTKENIYRMTDPRYTVGKKCRDPSSNFLGSFLVNIVHDPSAYG